MKPTLSLYIAILALGVICLSVDAQADWSRDKDSKRWIDDADETLKKLVNRKVYAKPAKNIILFLGDGMGVSTVTAGRIRKGQKKGNNGEEEITHMESLPYLALAKTYNIDAQVPDSAGTATAYLTGVKARIEAIGVDGHAVDCPTTLKHSVDSILKWAYLAGKSTGLVTTARITSASPAPAYSSAPVRYWEAYDNKYFTEKESKEGCKDIADQLVQKAEMINVVFGGGRSKFMKDDESDPTDPALKGARKDGRNLIEEWKTKLNNGKTKAKYVSNVDEFKSLKVGEQDYVLGLFSYDNMKYETDREQSQDEPSLIDMTKKAIELLSTNPNGYFLFVEGSNIDSAHHDSNAYRALDDFIMFDESIGAAKQLVKEEDTLMIVTADHSHVFTLGGYAIRGTPILGINQNKWLNVSDLAKLTYTNLAYSNGPGGLTEIRKRNLTDQEAQGVNYIQESAVFLNDETHGGEEVAIYAQGPMAHLFDGTVEQSYVAHLMAYSGCLGRFKDVTSVNPHCSNSSNSLGISLLSILLGYLICFLAKSL